MATKIKIRRSLFIGLGGTGMRSILYLKKLFIDTYGEVPPMVGFLGIDTDKGEFSKDLQTKSAGNVGEMTEGNIKTTLFVKENGSGGQSVKLDPSEQVQITVDSPQDIFKARKENFSWVPKENVRALQSLTHGAGQVRTNGRFALIANMGEVKDKINTTLANIANVNNIDNAQYQLIDDNTNPDIYLIFSLGGGTGCGTFIDLAYLIRKCAKDSNLAGYAILPEVFRTKYHNGMNRVMSNSYGAVADLDWLMSRDWSDQQITLPVPNGGKPMTTNATPFDACIFIDNENRNHDKYTDNKQLEEMVALSLITSVGELSVANASVLDNLAIDATGGEFDIQGKKAWVCGMGVCEVTVQSNEIRKIYAHNATQYLIRNLLNGSNMDQEALQWVNQVKICEHEADQVIDHLLKRDPVPMPELDKGDYEDALNVCNTYIAVQSQSVVENVNKNLNGLQGDIANKLRTFLIETLNRKQGGGVGSALEMLKSLNNNVELYLKEMKDEKSEFEEQEKNCYSALQSYTTELGNARFYENRKNMAADVTSTATELATIKREIIRRDAAISFFTDLIIRIKKHNDDIQLLKKNLEIVSDSSNKEAAKINFSLSKNTETFQYDISQYVMGQSNVKDNDVQISDFISSLSGNKIYDMIEIEKSNVWKTFLDYTYFSGHAEEIGKLSINEILKKLQDDKFDSLVKKIVVKASPLLPHDYHGWNTGNPAVNYYIGVSDFETNRLYEDEYFKTNVRGAADVNFSKIGMTDRLIVFSQMNPIPPFAIASISRCKEEYEDPNQTINFHFDKNIYEVMKRMGYSLFPCEAKEKNIELWIKGIIFGKIKNENGMYYIQSETEGKKLRHYWVALAGDREEAYSLFDEKSSVYGQDIKDFIDNFKQENGDAKYNEKIEYANTGDNYLNEVSQVNLTLEELEQKQYAGTMELLETEVEYLDKMLAK